MKILIYDVDCKESGTTYPLKSAFEAIGHQADMFDWRKYLFSYSNGSLPNRLKDRFLFDVVAYKINKELKKIIQNSGYDLFLVVRGEHIFSETIEFAKKHIPKVVNWNSDDLFNKLNSSKHVIRAFDKFDTHFSPRPHLKEEYLSKGAKSFEPLYWYYRIGLLYPEPDFSSHTYENEVSFVGSWSKRREEFLTPLVDEKLALYGWGWKKKMDTNAFTKWDFNNSIRIDDMMKIMSKSKINLNILTIENRDSNNFRNYEIPASGGFQMSERSDFISELFEEDKEIVCFESKEELKSKCDFYLKNDSIREKIALAGYNRLVKGNNALTDRAEQIVKVALG